GLPGDALRIGHPVLLAAGVATGRLAFVEQGHVGGLRASLHLCEVFGIVSLDAEMVDAGPAAPRGDGEVDRRLSQFPLGVVGFDPDRFGVEHRRVEANVRRQVIDMEMHMKAFHDEAPLAVAGGGVRRSGWPRATSDLMTLVYSMIQE